MHLLNFAPVLSETATYPTNFSSVNILLQNCGTSNLKQLVLNCCSFIFLVGLVTAIEDKPEFYV